MNTPQRPPCVLLLDDDELLSISIVTLLEDEGFSVTAFRRGEKALENRKRFDIALVDMRLPDIDGAEWILSAKTMFPNAHFLIFTGTPDYVLPERLQSIGMTGDDILMKPISGKEITARIRRKLESART